MVGHLFCNVHHPRRLARVSAIAPVVPSPAQSELLQRLSLSSSVSNEVAAVEGLRRALDEKLLHPLLALIALHTLAVLETKEGRLLGIVEGELGSGLGLGNRMGVTSQWVRKCSPSTGRVRRNRERTYDEFEVLWTRRGEYVWYIEVLPILEVRDRFQK